MANFSSSVFDLSGFCHSIVMPWQVCQEYQPKDQKRIPIGDEDDETDNGLKVSFVPLWLTPSLSFQPNVDYDNNINKGWN